MFKVLRDVQNDVLVLALKGTDDIKTLFSPTSHGRWKICKKNSIYGSPTRLSAVEEAQQSVVAVIRRLDETGEIYIGRATKMQWSNSSLLKQQAVKTTEAARSI